MFKPISLTGGGLPCQMNRIELIDAVIFLFRKNLLSCRFDHPRFGKIKCIRTIRPVKAGEELTVEYGYDHNGLGPNNPDAPQWYKDQYEQFNSVKDSVT